MLVSTSLICLSFSVECLLSPRRSQCSCIRVNVYSRCLMQAKYVFKLFLLLNHRIYNIIINR
jgi:hypothetical protein